MNSLEYITVSFNANCFFISSCSMLPDSPAQITTHLCKPE